MSRLNITIIGINYAPEHTGIAPYTTELAEHLAKKHNVTVLTGVPHYPQWSVAPGHRRWRYEEQRNGVRVVRHRHFVPSRPNALTRAGYELTFAARVLAARSSSPDVVLAVVPTLFSAMAAARIARRSAAPLGVVVQDLMGNAAEQSGTAGGSTVAGLIRSVEARVLRASAGVAVIHERFAQSLSNVYGLSNNKVTVIRNWSHVRPLAGHTDVSDVRQHLGADTETVVLHTGNIGVKQNLENVVSAARLADERRLPVRFVLMGDGNQRDRIAALADGAERLTLLDPVDSDLYPKMLAAADVLLLNERPGMAEMSVPSKLTSYLVAGRPVLAATDEGSATAQEVRRSGGGWVVPAGEPGQLLEAVLRLRSDGAARSSLAQAGRDYARSQLSAAPALAKYESWITGLATAGSVAPGERSSATDAVAEPHERNLA